MVVSEYDSESLNEVNHRNIALSCVAHGTGGVDKLTIARSFNMSVFAYNRAVVQTQHYCISSNTSFKELRQ